MTTPVTTRIRRGKVVAIPEQWRNRIPTDRTMRARKSAQLVKRLDRRRRVEQEGKDFETVMQE